jgi:hypothetical protein
MKEYKGEEIVFTLALVMREWYASCSIYLCFQGKGSGTLPRLVGPRAVLIIAIKTKLNVSTGKKVEANFRKVKHRFPWLSPILYRMLEYLLHTVDCSFLRLLSRIVSTFSSHSTQSNVRYDKALSNTV